MDALARYSKAVAGFLAPGVIALPAALLPASDGGSSITGYEVATILALMFGTAFGVGLAPRNRRP